MMSFFHRTLALFLAVTSVVTALPTSNTPRDDVPIQGVGHAAPPPPNPSAPKPRIVQVSPEALAAAIANVTSRPPFPPAETVSFSPRTTPIPPWAGSSARTASSARGTLIGPRHVTTAKHCIPSDSSVSVKFQPAYDGKERFPSAYVTDVLAPAAGASDQCNYKDDWAVVILDTRLGDARGYMSYDIMPASKADQAIFYSYGYPSDKSADVSKPYRQEAITVAKKNSFKCDQYGPLNTNADANGGQSGSPIWLPPDANGVRTMYGVMSSSSATATFFAGGEVWAGGIQYMLSSYP
ncbi:hypothetical protein PG993_003921 [Apiospora rasikravindrae]|uniref:Serine protease n=1 Tax=Apiospora rasikravindrae TaxID=990691 RepID=A0ABR1U347_9PEZI